MHWSPWLLNTRRMKEPTMTYEEVASTLENFLEGREGPWDWDSYLSTRFKDVYLQEVQNRMDSLPNDFPRIEEGHYCNPDGFIVIRKYIDELRRRAKAQRE